MSKCHSCELLIELAHENETYQARIKELEEIITKNKERAAITEVSK
jgi:hypothetical protein